MNPEHYNSTVIQSTINKHLNRIIVHCAIKQKGGVLYSGIADVMLVNDHHASELEVEM